MKRMGIGSGVRGVVAAAVVAGLLPIAMVTEGGGLGGGVAVAAESPDAVQAKFEAFAAEWMEKLRERERFNAKNVKWRPAGEGVEGLYVGYDTANYRLLPLSNVETMPIGKIVYLELKLRLAGGSEDDARAGRPQIVERVEVTELFRYHGGKWVY